jgi:hypothetical protein
MYKFGKKEKMPIVKNVERKNIESAINAASAHYSCISEGYGCYCRLLTQC